MNSPDQSPGIPSTSDATSASRLLEPLSALSALGLGLPAYYQNLTESSDLIVKVGAYCALLDLQVISRSQWNAVLELTRYGAVQMRAYSFFKAFLNHEWAAKALANEPVDALGLVLRGMRADFNNDDEAMVEVERLTFLADGNLARLHSAATHAEVVGGWRLAAEWVIRAIILHPIEANAPTRLGQMLVNANQFDALAQFVGLLERYHAYPTVRQIYAAALAMEQGDAKACIKHLQTLPKSRPQRIEPYLIGLRAKAAEALGEYRDAYTWFERQNKLSRNPEIDASLFAAAINHRAQIPVPLLPDDPRQNCHMMVGFPRSGTTLLENALAAHPLIETFEEIPSTASVYTYYEQVEREDGSEATRNAETALAARQRYYGELDRRRTKPEATCLVDKMPIRSADARFLVKVFPDKKYIFSIRHPFDVVLSCFKQDFKPNVAMANLHTIPDAIRTYDFAMSEWFSTYGFDDPRVHYVRYDRLVTDFEAETRAVCDFLGVEWDDRVLAFATSADARKVKTPSYQKVRSGLSIGVQSAWENYRFLFDGPEAVPLKKWAMFFDYPTS